MTSRRRLPPTSSLLLLLFFSGCTGRVEASKPDTHSALSPRWRSASLRLLVLNGQEDYDNRYLSAVVVEGPGQDGPCTGVLVHPRLVLTAAHCVCPSDGKLLDSERCLKSTSVTAYTYKQQEGIYTRAQRSQRGTVQPHEKFKVQRDDNGIVKASTSDLAVIFLEAPLSGIRIGFDLTKTEPDVHDEVTVAGYGRTEKSKGERRFFGRNNVTDKGRSNLTDRDDKDVSLLFEMTGAHMTAGDSGGPCFIEDGHKQWLVGITAQGDGTTSRFTSIYRHLAWLNAQLEKAKQKSL